MNKKKLGNSDMELTPIGFGSWAIGGGDWQFSWGPQDDNDSIAAIHKALELGINWIDTAAVYGLGHSEEVVARALKTTPHKPYIFTKCGSVWDEKREVTNSLKQIRREAEDSLRRLGVEAIDLYQMHWPKPDEEIEEAWGVMADLQKQGKVRWIGVSNFSVEQMKRVMQDRSHHLEPAALLHAEPRGGGRDPALLRENNIGVINYAPMHSGLLTGAMTSSVSPISPATISAATRRTTRSLCSRATWRWPTFSPNRCEARRERRRGGDCLDPASPCHHRGHRRRPQRKAGRGRDSRGDLPLIGTGVLRNPELPRPTRFAHPAN
jgi:aryl-alcohol dehydrogenase-like predicted oxidoreductase